MGARERTAERTRGRANGIEILLVVQKMETWMSPEHMFHGAEIDVWNFTLVSPSKCAAMLIW